MKKGVPKMKNPPEPPTPKISFARELVQRMVSMTGSVVQFDKLSDNSCQFITVVKDEHELCISFDGDGEQITDITLSKQIKQVVDYEHLWSVTLKTKTK